jgi:hypothetical protein
MDEVDEFKEYVKNIFTEHEIRTIDHAINYIDEGKIIRGKIKWKKRISIRSINGVVVCIGFGDESDNR